MPWSGSGEGGASLASAEMTLIHTHVHLVINSETSLQTCTLELTMVEDEGLAIMNDLRNSLLVAFRSCSPSERTLRSIHTAAFQALLFSLSRLLQLPFPRQSL